MIWDLSPPYLPDSSQWKWTSTDLIIKPKALINANVNLPHNPGEWALTSDSAGQNCSDLRWCFCSAAQLRLFITHGDWEDYRKSDSFSFLSLIYVFCKRKCKSDCYVGHMLVVGTVSIVMILIHQSRCTVCPILRSVGLSELLNDCLSGGGSHSHSDSDGLPQHYFLISPTLTALSLHMVQKYEFFLNIPAVWLRPCLVSR